jgi:hypothetical protein
MALDTIAELDEHRLSLALPPPYDDVVAVGAAPGPTPPPALPLDSVLHRMRSYAPAKATDAHPAVASASGIALPRRIISASDSFQAPTSTRAPTLAATPKSSLASPAAAGPGTPAPKSSAAIVRPSSLSPSPPPDMVVAGRLPAPSHAASPSYAPISRLGAQDLDFSTDVLARPHYTSATAGHYPTPPRVPPIHIARGDARPMPLPG